MTRFSERGNVGNIDVFCVSIPNKVQERQMSVTHRSLRALLLAPDVWDLPLVVDRCYRLRVAPLAVVLGPVFDVLLVQTVVTAGLLQPLTISQHLSLQHYH